MRLILLLLTLWSSGTALASRVQRARLDDLTRGAQLVILGTLLTREAYWEGGRILTRNVVRVDETWAGAKPATETVEAVTLGGIVGNIGQQVSGEAVVPADTPAVLFLSAQHGVYRVVGLSQGVFAVTAGAGGTQLITRRLDGLEWAGGSGPERVPTSLEDLRARVREMDRAR